MPSTASAVDTSINLGMDSSYAELTALRQSNADLRRQITEARACQDSLWRKVKRLAGVKERRDVDAQTEEGGPVVKSEARGDVFIQ